MSPGLPEADISDYSPARTEDRCGDLFVTNRYSKARSALRSDQIAMSVDEGGQTEGCQGG